MFLKVLDKRSDGYHNLTTVYQNITLSDLLLFEKLDHGIEVTCDTEGVPNDERNLVWKTARLMQSLFPNQVGGVRIYLEKGIPAGAGFGGGSADAAATLSALNSLYHLNLHQERLLEIAASLGKDIPFFLLGNCALATGTGERLLSIPRKGDFHVLCVYPGFEISTKTAYERFDRSPVISGQSPDLLLEALEEGSFETISQCLYNSFTDILETVFPDLRQIRSDLIDAGCKGVLLSGSGSGTFGLIERKEEADRVMHRIESIYPWVAIAQTASNAYEVRET